MQLVYKLLQSFSIKTQGSSILSEEDWQTLAVGLNLHGRMLDTVRGIFDDKTESTIASDLGISKHTAHTYLERVRQKLTARTRVEMVLVIMRAFLRLKHLSVG